MPTIAVDATQLLGAAAQSSPLVQAISPRRIVWAVANAMTAAAGPATVAGRAHLQQRLDRPKPWTLALKSWPRRVIPEHLVHSVGVPYPGRPHPLVTQERGGERPLKPIELRSGSGFISPLPSLGLDRYGGIRKRHMIQIAAAVTGRAVARHRRGQLTSSRNPYHTRQSRRAATKVVLRRQGRTTTPVAVVTRRSPRYQRRIQLSAIMHTAYRQALAQLLPAEVADQWQRRYRPWRARYH